MGLGLAGKTWSCTTTASSTARRPWRSETPLSLPRITRSASGFRPVVEVGDRHYVQALAALRLAEPDAGIVAGLLLGPILQQRLFGRQPVSATFAAAIADITGDFVYARLQTGNDELTTCYPPKQLDAWAKRSQVWAAGVEQDALPRAAREFTTAAQAVLSFIREACSMLKTAKSSGMPSPDSRYGIAVR